jgi:hypothetical protein
MAYLFSVEEKYIELHTCEACNVFVFPAISHLRLEEFYTFSESTKLPETLKFTNLFHIGPETDSSVPAYRWSDIEELVQKGDLRLRPAQPTGIEPHRYHAEEYGCFGFSDNMARLTSRLSNDWPKRLSFARAQHWWELKEQNPQYFSPSEYRPIIIEVMLLEEFLRRFSPSQLCVHTEEKAIIAEYYEIISSWAQKGAWSERPWRIYNLPDQPRCLITNPHATTEEKKKFHKEAEDYISRCSQIPAVMKVFPDILRCPCI